MCCFDSQYDLCVLVDTSHIGQSGFDDVSPANNEFKTYVIKRASCEGLHAQGKLLNQIGHDQRTIVTIYRSVIGGRIRIPCRFRRRNYNRIEWLKSQLRYNQHVNAIRYGMIDTIGIA